MLRFVSAFIILACFTADATACSIPVFRYALERWQPASFQVVIFHDQEISEKDRTVFSSALKPGGEVADKMPTTLAPWGINATVHQVDLRKPLTKDAQAIYDRLPPNITLPYVVVRDPSVVDTPALLWQGGLQKIDFQEIFTNKVRTQIASTLTRGNVAVLVVKPGPDAAENNRLRTLLNDTIPKLEKTIDLPMPSADGPQLLSAMPLYVGIEVVWLDDSTNKDLIFERNLLNLENDLDRHRGSIVFPIFGRGRALCALYGKDLEKSSEIESAIKFLCRACSCQVKELNPGIDLLIQHPWDEIFLINLGPAPREVRTEVFDNPLPKSNNRPEPSERPMPVLRPTGDVRPELRSAPENSEDAGILRAAARKPSPQPWWQKQRSLLISICSGLFLAAVGWLYFRR
ncbi:MAG: hypothetical protein R3B84_14780 [Zavarzinella sp.]